MEECVKMVWTEIIEHLKITSILEIHLVPQILEEKLNVKFDPEHWCFGKVGMFYTYGMQMSPELPLFYLPDKTHVKRGCLVKVVFLEPKTLTYLSQWINQAKDEEQEQEQVANLLKKLGKKKEGNME
jgi:hypothetical protein